MRRTLLGFTASLALLGCGDAVDDHPEQREDMAAQLRSQWATSDFANLFLDLARRYREIYLPGVDFNGDGRADFAAGTITFEDEQVNVFYGGPNGFSDTPDQVLASPDPTQFLTFGTPASAGDVNNDGFGDLIVGANNALGTGAAHVYFGGPDGLSSTPDQTLNGADADPSSVAFGFQVASAKDVDLDGYDDVLVSAIATTVTETQDGAVYLYRGGPGGLETTPSATLLGAGGFLDNFGTSMISTYLNADPYPDFVIGEARFFSFGGSSRGRVHVFLGGPSGPAATADVVIEGPSGPALGFGLSVANVGDLNLDGRGDFAVGEPLLNDATGRAYVYLGTSTGVDVTPGLQLEAPEGNTGGFFGWDLAGGGDVDRNGFADLVVGETDAQDLRGEAHLYYGPLWPVRAFGQDNPVVVTSPDQTIMGTHTEAGFFGQDIAFVGDADGNRSDELLIGALAADDFDGRVYVFEGMTSGTVELEQTIASPLPGGTFGSLLSN